MKLGLENKRNVVALSVLGLVALYGVYSNFSDSPSTPSSPAPVSTAVAPPTIGSSEPDRPPVPRARAKNEEWHPVVHPTNKEDQVNPATIDPSLHLELLTKVMNVKQAGGARNLFEFGAVKPVLTAANLPPEPKITGPKQMGPTELPPPPPPPVAPPPPPPPPIMAKYYGFASPANSAVRRGFFMEGEDIQIKSEGEMLERRYKIVRLDSGSVTLQDVDTKSTRTLNMVEDAS